MLLLPIILLIGLFGGLVGLVWFGLLLGEGNHVQYFPVLNWLLGVVRFHSLTVLFLYPFHPEASFGLLSEAGLVVVNFLTYFYHGKFLLLYLWLNFAG